MLHFDMNSEKKIAKLQFCYRLLAMIRNNICFIHKIYILYI